MFRVGKTIRYIGIAVLLFHTFLTAETAIVTTGSEPPTREISFSQFADGGGFSSSIFLTNPSTTKVVSGLIRFYDDNGMRSTVPLEGVGATSEVPFAVAPLGRVVITTGGGSRLVSGSARVIADGSIAGVLRFNYPPLGLAVICASTTAAGFIIPVIRNAGGNLSTGIAVASAGSAVTLNFTLRGTAGDPVPGGQATIRLSANGHVARFIQELFPQADTQEFQGTVTITADGGDITATGIEMGSKPGEMTTVPAAAIRDPF